MEKDNQDEFSPEEKKAPSRTTGLLVPLVIVLLVGGAWMLWSSWPATTEIPYSAFLDQLERKNVAEVRLYADRAVGRFKEPPDLAALTDTADSKTKSKAGEGSKAAAAGKKAREYF